jgi:hypothetical protein
MHPGDAEMAWIASLLGNNSGSQPQVFKDYQAVA